MIKRRFLLVGATVTCVVSSLVATSPASAAEGTVGFPGCSVTYDTGSIQAGPGGVSYTGPSFTTDTRDCLDPANKGE